MPIFKVFWSELYDFEANVEAKTLDEAIEKVRYDPSIYAPDINSGQYVDDSLMINRGFTEEMNKDVK